MKTQLLDLSWPDVDKFFTEQPITELDAGLLECVQRVLPFCPDPKFPVIKFSDTGVSTADGEMQAEMGGVTLPTGSYRAEPLLLVLSVATHADFYLYPNPVKWCSRESGLEGVLVGVKL